MKAVLFVCLFLGACNSARIKQDTNLNINIKFEQSYAIDLNEKVYTVFFLSRSPFSVKFNLTGDETKKINDIYFLLKLYELGNIELKDTCMIHPKMYTYIYVKSNSIDQRIKIDESCGFSEDSQAYKVQRFLKLIQKIIESKEEIKNAPDSDVEYL